ncbi:uncharacterized protein AKAW2_21539A [Aspergillus luchuensis]|uniref:Uncharacterized protein n=1 Tax=Aspergillus kawachii TaxID=1069201 RepID=A0A7R7W5A5_ASPKA|nr:uncharacterized protein AKAW2_21539A [Aspergillus luchuensis]BCR96599.1 hypothetical protein AKAW2_21539A [Aspergillus luchuensis]
MVKLWESIAEFRHNNDLLGYVKDKECTRLCLETALGKPIGDCHLIVDPMMERYSLYKREPSYLPTYLVLLRIRPTERRPKQQAAITPAKNKEHSEPPTSQSPPASALRNRINHKVKARSLEGTTTVSNPTNQDTRKQRS